MPEIIRNGRVVTDDWTFEAPDPGTPIAARGRDAPAESNDPPIAAEKTVYSFASWKQQREELIARGGTYGVWLEPADDPAELVPDLDRLQLVAIQFPKFTDGRGYSSAALLRTRYGYRGELRAIGDVGRDQLFYLKRCGFDAFALAPHRDPHAALASLEDFSLRYQGSVDDPLPLFRKRAAVAAP